MKAVGGGGDGWDNKKARSEGSGPGLGVALGEAHDEFVRIGELGCLGDGRGGTGIRSDTEVVKRPAAWRAYHGTK